MSEVIGVLALLSSRSWMITPTRSRGTVRRPIHSESRRLGIVDRDHVYTFAFEGVEVRGRVATSVFPSRLYFGDFAAMEGDPAVSTARRKCRMLRTRGRTRRTTANAFDQQVVQWDSLAQFLFKFDGFGGQVDVGSACMAGSRSLIAATIAAWL